MKDIKIHYYRFQAAAVAFILLSIIMIVANVFADGTTTPSSQNNWSELATLMQGVTAGLLAYMAWSIKRFIRKVDSIHGFLNKAIKVLVMIATEHKSNHVSCVNIDELLKAEGGE